MSFNITVHFDNSRGLHNPHLFRWNDGSSLTDDLAPAGTDAFGVFYNLDVVRSEFRFKFKAGPGLHGPWEDDSLNRFYSWLAIGPGRIEPAAIWCKGDKAFVYDVEPRAPESISAEAFIAGLPLNPKVFIPDTGGRSGLGATVLADGTVLFGLYHPNAARVYVMGDFNDWQRPGVEHPEPSKFIELRLYRGYFNIPNLWLDVTDVAAPGHEYKFFIQGGVPGDHQGRYQKVAIDPYTRRFGPSFTENNCVIVDPTTFPWTDQHVHTPDPSQLILYELSIYGFTEGDPDIKAENRGTFRGVTERIHAGYFDLLGVTALSIMPLTEFPDLEGGGTLGYNPSVFCTVERDFGTPDDLRELVNAAHTKGLAVMLDQVFNHTGNDFNPLWQLILEHPHEENHPDEGGLYFNGSTLWGNRLATEKTDVQNMLIDACKLLITEYHVDGFRFDATHTDYMDHRLPLRLADEVKRLKPDALLVAENLPNQADLNRQGFDGYAQWCDPFHDKIKALLREGTFQDSNFYNTDRIGTIFFFSKDIYASHTNNAVNYCESHDENSVPFEIKFNPSLNNPDAKERKGRLGMFSAMTALGQPMMYMGQEFNVERERNFVTVQWPDHLDQHGFFQWARRLMQLRKRYPGLKLSGYNPAEDGRFTVIIAPWLAGNRGGGQRLIGWRSRPNSLATDALVVMLNFENHDISVDVDFGIPGIWLKLADIDFVNDIPPHGNNSPSDATALRTNDGNFSNFNLPSSSGFIYKWEASL